MEDHKEKSQRAKERSAEERSRHLADVRFVMQSPQGRRVLWKLMEQGKIFKGCFTGNSRTFYELGKREIALDLLNDVVEADMMGFWQMQAESLQDSEQGRQLRSMLIHLKGD